MSVQLDNLIAIFRDNTESLSDGEICSMVNCSGTYCNECPFNDEKSISNLVEELEVLQHAKA